MQQSQKSAFKAKPESLRFFRLKRQCRIIELQFFHGLSQAIKLATVFREKTCVNHRLQNLIPRKRRDSLFFKGGYRGIFNINGYSITDSAFLNFFQSSYNISNFSG